MKDVQTMFVVKYTTKEGKQGLDILCTTHTVFNLYIQGATVHSIKRYGNGS